LLSLCTLEKVPMNDQKNEGCLNYCGVCMFMLCLVQNSELSLFFSYKGEASRQDSI
jgi:uncharacterized protein YuzB (UPF0349 family)